MVDGQLHIHEIHSVDFTVLTSLEESMGVPVSEYSTVARVCR